MPRPINFPDANRNLTKPGNMTDEECSSMYVYTDNRTCVSCWQFSDDEIRQLINNDGKLWLGLLSGASQPPVFLDTNCPIAHMPTECAPPPVEEMEDAFRQFASRLPGPEFAGSKPLTGAELLRTNPGLRKPDGSQLEADQMYFVSSAEAQAMHLNEMRIAYSQGGKSAVAKYLLPYAEFLHTPETQPAQ